MDQKESLEEILVSVKIRLVSEPGELVSPSQ